MAKRIRAYVKLQIPAGKATPAPPVGPALGQHGVAIMNFVKEYNERTANMAGQTVPVLITVYEDRSFTFVTKTPPASDLLRRAAGIDKGSSNAPGRKVGAWTTVGAGAAVVDDIPDGVVAVGVPARPVIA